MTDDIRKEIESIRIRNARVEADKAWEVSRCRLILVSVITYMMMTLLMGMLGVERYYLSALVPTMGFILSNLSLRFAKQYWVDSFYKKRC